MPFYTKSMIAIAFLAIGILAALTMLALMGRSEPRANPKALKRAHSILGFLFFVLLLILSFVGLGYVSRAPGELAPRAVFHIVFAVSILAIIVLKLLIVRFYRGLLGVVPTLGMTLFVLIFLVFGSSAGYFFARSGAEEAFELEEAEALIASGSEITAVRSTGRGDAGRGSALYEKKCAFCHYADRTEGKLGPGLAGVLRGEALPSSGRPATAENVILQLEEPIGTMPSFRSLSAQEVADLVAYLETI
jgi:mono/diheme cytochrome c family protein